MEHDCRFLQIEYRKCMRQQSQCAQHREEKYLQKKQNTKLDVLTEKHPVLLGVWPAPLLCGKAHVCCCCQTRPWWSEH